MNNWKKDKISINNVGKTNFWFGIIIGILTATTLSFSFNYFREFFRLFSQMNTDLLILSDKKVWFYTFFFSYLSSFLGLNMTLWIWMNTDYQKRRKYSLLKRTAKMYHLLFFWFFLFIITRFCSAISTVFFGVGGPSYFEELIDNYINFFLLIPIFLFFKSWSVIQLVFKCRLWMIYSFIICMILSIILTFISKVDQSVLNNSYHKRFEKEYQYIDDEVAKTYHNYNFKLKDETIKALKERNTDASQFQVFKVREAFNSNSKVSLDTIILQRMIIHNFKENWVYLNENDRFNYNRWMYVTPFDIKNQLLLFNEDDDEATELFKLLREIENVSYFKHKVDDIENLNETEYRKYMFSKNEEFHMGFDVYSIFLLDEELKTKFPKLIKLLYFYEAENYTIFTE